MYNVELMIAGGYIKWGSKTVTTSQLAEHLQKPETMKLVLGSYHGPFSLGVGLDPENREPAINLRISGGEIGDIPEAITIEGQQVRVIAHKNFVAPKSY